MTKCPCRSGTTASLRKAHERRMQAAATTHGSWVGGDGVGGAWRPASGGLKGARMRRHRALNSVSTCLRLSVSATNCGTTSDCHTSANGSSRMRHHRGAFTVDGNGPLCHLRAARSLIPAAAAVAAANVLPAIRFSRNRRTCASVTNRSSTRKRAVSHVSRVPPRPAYRRLGDRQKQLSLISVSRPRARRALQRGPPPPRSVHEDGQHVGAAAGGGSGMALSAPAPAAARRSPAA